VAALNQMRISYMPVLGILRELYLQPRNMQRFRNYVAMLTGGGDDVVVPIGVANPMAKEQAVATIEKLLELGAEEIGAEAARDAAERLARVEIGDVEIKASVVLADDVGGGWTNRYTTEAMVRFPSRGALKRPFATALVWTSETPTAATLREEVLAAIYRVAWQQRHQRLPTALVARLDQEGLAALFAGARPWLTGADLDRVREIVRALGEDPPYPTVFAALYGDEAAQELGYQPLGLPPRGGFGLALAAASEVARDPVATLVSSRNNAPIRPRTKGPRA
jgi:hypothetical protein